MSELKHVGQHLGGSFSLFLFLLLLKVSVYLILADKFRMSFDKGEVYLLKWKLAASVRAEDWPWLFWKLASLWILLFCNLVLFVCMWKISPSQCSDFHCCCFLKITFMFFAWVCKSFCVDCVFRSMQRPKEGTKSPGPGDTGPACRCWEPKPGLQQEPQVPLPTEPPLQPVL